jgi:hypothetical protein
MAQFVSNVRSFGLRLNEGTGSLVVATRPVEFLEPGREECRQEFFKNRMEQCPTVFLVAAETLDILRRVESLQGCGGQVCHQTIQHIGNVRVKFYMRL